MSSSRNHSLTSPNKALKLSAAGSRPCSTRVGEASRGRSPAAIGMSCILAACASSPVIDDENFLLRIWLPASWGALVVFFATRWRPWTAALVLPATVLIPVQMLLEVYGPLRNEILRDVGLLYILQAHLGLAAVLTAFVLGWCSNSRRARETAA